MIRYVVMLRRRPELSREDFLAAWLGQHLAMARDLPGVVDAVFMPSASVDSDYDGVGYLDFVDLEAMQAALATQAALTLRAHTATFAASEEVVRCVVNVP